MWQWGIAALLVLEAHFAASFLVPLDEPSQQELGGALRWLWPWAHGDSGPLGRVTAAEGSPLPGLVLAVTAAGLFALAAMAFLHWWVPVTWWRPLAAVGAICSFALMALFFGPTKLLPMALDAAVLVLVWQSSGVPDPA